MLKFMEKRWGFNIDDWNDVTYESTLNLEFIENNKITKTYNS